MTVISITGNDIESGPLHNGVIKLAETLIDVARTALDDVLTMQSEGWVDLDTLRIHLTTIHDVSVFVKAAGESIDQGLR